MAVHNNCARTKQLACVSTEDTTNHEQAGTQRARRRQTRGKQRGEEKHTSRVRDDGADDTGDVTGRERDAELSALAVGALGLGENVGVERLDDLPVREEGLKVSNPAQVQKQVWWVGATQSKERPPATEAQAAKAGSSHAHAGSKRRAVVKESLHARLGLCPERQAGQQEQSVHSVSTQLPPRQVATAHLLEEEELGHGVGDLARPEGHERAEGEAGLSLQRERPERARSAFMRVIEVCKKKKNNQAPVERNVDLLTEVFALNRLPSGD